MGNLNTKTQKEVKSYYEWTIQKLLTRTGSERKE